MVVGDLSDRGSVEALLDEVARTFERAFPERIRAIYLHGSLTDDTALATSDIDLDVVVVGAFRGEAERRALAQTARALSAASALELDIELTDEATLLAGAEPTFKLGSRLIWGEDLRRDVPLVPVEEWGRERMFRGYYLLVRVFQRRTPVRLPLGFPDPADPFFGYAKRPTRAAGGQLVLGTRDLVRVTGWLATALIAWEGRRYVIRKRDCRRLYREIFHDEWADLLDEVSATCRERWSYLIPTEPLERAQLRRICERVLEFENHFLTRFIPFVVAELRAQRSPESRARWLLAELPLDDAEVRAALRGGRV